MLRLEPKTFFQNAILQQRDLQIQVMFWAVTLLFYKFITEEKSINMTKY